MSRLRRLLLVPALTIAVTGCGGGGTTPARDTSADDLTPEQKLAVIHGDLDSEAQFARILDQLQAGAGACEPVAVRERAADVIVASWQDGGESGSLLDWAQNLVTACGG